MRTMLKAFLHMISILAIYFLTLSFSNYAFQFCHSAIGAVLAYVCLNIASVLIAAYLYTKYIMKQSLLETYLGSPLPSLKWCLVGIIIPFLIDLFYLIFTDGFVQKGYLSWGELAYILISDILRMGLRAALVEEILFRGVALSALQKMVGKKGGIFLSSFLYALMRLAGMDLPSRWEALLIFMAAYIAGLAFSIVTYDTGSIWSSVVIHALYNLLAGDSQIFHIDTEQTFPAICSYTLKKESWPLTGVSGAAGLDTALPALIGFILIIILAIASTKKKESEL